MDENRDMTEAPKEEPLKKRHPLVRILAVLAAAALVALSYFIFRYGYLWRI